MPKICVCSCLARQGPVLEERQARLEHKLAQSRQTANATTLRHGVCVDCLAVRSIRGHDSRKPGPACASGRHRFWRLLDLNPPSASRKKRSILAPIFVELFFSFFLFAPGSVRFVWRTDATNSSPKNECGNGHPSSAKKTPTIRQRIRCAYGSPGTLAVVTDSWNKKGASEPPTLDGPS